MRPGISLSTLPRVMRLMSAAVSASNTVECAGAGGRHGYQRPAFAVRVLRGAVGSPLIASS